MTRPILAIVIIVSLLAGCGQESEPVDEQTLPTQDAIGADHILNYLSKVNSQELPADTELAAIKGTAPPMEQLMLGLSLAASPDRGTEAPPFLATALETDAIEWQESGRTLIELLLRRTRVEQHYWEARQAADASLASERVRRQELEATVKALRQIDREMREDPADDRTRQ